MKVAYVTTYDATDVRNWSGIGYHMAESLKDQSLEVSYIGELDEHRRVLYKAKQLLYGRLLGKQHLRDREPTILEKYAEQVADRLERTGADVVFSPGTIPISYLECPQPIVFWTDATFAGMVDFYPAFSNLSAETIENGNRAERSALTRSALALYSSEWAAETAIESYGIDGSRTGVVPFGANVESGLKLEDVREILRSRPTTTCKLLFLGVDWRRKGGETALEVARELNERGLNTELTVAGCEPETDEPLPGFVRSLGFIGKSSASGRKRIDGLIAESHFLILPSRADATPIVFCEANSFGVPCLTTNVGGIPSLIRNDVNGRMFSPRDDPSSYCEYVLELMSDYPRYRRLALSSFDEYATRLNWDAAGKTVKELLKKCCA